MRSENFGDGELLVLQVRIAGAGRPSPCVTLGSCFDLFKGSKVTDVLETLGRNKNKKKKRKKPIANFTMQCRNKEFSPTILLVGHRDICWKVGNPSTEFLPRAQEPWEECWGIPADFWNIFYIFLPNRIHQKGQKIENSRKMVGRFVKLDEFWDTRWESFVLPNASLLRCASQHPGI